MNVSIGIMAYNEEANIKFILNAILRQEAKEIKIKEIIVVDDGSTDNTRKKIESIKDKRIKLIRLKKRKGKWNAINHFLAKSKNKVCVLESADNIPEKNAIESLCLPLNKKEIGVVCGRMIPVNKKNTIIGEINHVVYNLHHLVSMEQPKYGEIIAFKKVIDKIGPTNVDEEAIASKILEQGFKGVYEPKSFVHNKGPEKLVELIQQRRRHFCGHLQLNNKYNHSTSTLNKKILFKKLIAYWIKEWQNTFSIISTLVIEAVSRMLGWIDYKKGKDYSLWAISESTKKIK